MSEFKGTKGKWFLRIISEGQISVSNEIDTRTICVPRVQNHEEALANLLLISKAPEMLEMLQICKQTTNSKQIYDEIEQLIKSATEL
jgi:hypothetical protein